MGRVGTRRLSSITLSVAMAACVTGGSATAPPLVAPAVPATVVSTPVVKKTPEPLERYSWATWLNLREAADKSSTVMARLDMNVKLLVAHDASVGSDGFIRVQTPTKEGGLAEGWVAAEFLHDERLTKEEALSRVDGQSSYAGKIKWMERAANLDTQDRGISRKLQKLYKELAWLYSHKAKQVEEQLAWPGDIWFDNHTRDRFSRDFGVPPNPVDIVWLREYRTKPEHTVEIGPTRGHPDGGREALDAKWGPLLKRVGGTCSIAELKKNRMVCELDMSDPGHREIASMFDYDTTISSDWKLIGPNEKTVSATPVFYVQEQHWIGCGDSHFEGIKLRVGLRASKKGVYVSALDVGKRAVPASWDQAYVSEHPSLTLDSARALVAKKVRALGLTLLPAGENHADQRLDIWYQRSLENSNAGQYRGLAWVDLNWLQSGSSYGKTLRKRYPVIGKCLQQDRGTRGKCFLEIMNQSNEASTAWCQVGEMGGRCTDFQILFSVNVSAAGKTKVKLGKLVGKEFEGPMLSDGAHLIFARDLDGDGFVEQVWNADCGYEVLSGKPGKEKSVYQYDSGNCPCGC